jgi:hypothetical protein
VANSVNAQRVPHALIVMDTMSEKQITLRKKVKDEKLVAILVSAKLIPRNLIVEDTRSEGQTEKKLQLQVPGSL